MVAGEESQRALQLIYVCIYAVFLENFDLFQPSNIIVIFGAWIIARC